MLAWDDGAKQGAANSRRLFASRAKKPAPPVSPSQRGWRENAASALPVSSVRSTNYDLRRPSRIPSAFRANGRHVGLIQRSKESAARSSLMKTGNPAAGGGKGGPARGRVGVCGAGKFQPRDR